MRERIVEEEKEKERRRRRRGAAVATDWPGVPVTDGVPAGPRAWVRPTPGLEQCVQCERERGKREEREER